MTESFADGLQADAVVDEFGGMGVPELVLLDVFARGGRPPVEAFLPWAAAEAGLATRKGAPGGPAP